MLISLNIIFRNLINWEQRCNFKCVHYLSMVNIYLEDLPGDLCRTIYCSFHDLMVKQQAEIWYVGHHHPELTQKTMITMVTKQLTILYFGHTVFFSYSSSLHTVPRHLKSLLVIQTCYIVYDCFRTI